MAMTLPARYYVDPEHHRREFDRAFGSGWFCVGRAEEIPEVGDWTLREVGSESVIVARAGADTIRAYYNVCRHRGTRVCDAAELDPATGRAHAHRLQCPYHAWTYDLDGRLVAAPHFDEGSEFARADFGLKPVAADTWAGMLFLNLADRPGPLLDALGSLPDRFARWNMGELRRGARVVYDVAANWKLLIQNYSECLHCPIIHPALSRVSHYLSGDNEVPGPNPTALGGRMTLRPGIATMSFDGAARRQALPGLTDDDCRHVSYYALLPNLLLSVHPDYLMTHVLRPLAVDRTEVVCEWHFHPDELARPGFDPGDAVDFWDLTNRQDWRVSELTQLGLTSRSYTPGPYSDREELLHAFDRWVVALETDRT